MQQRRCVEYSGKHLLVLAGAGSGKTRTIIARAKYLLSHGVKPSRMLILSFTRKSAREIVGRINSSLSTQTKELKGQTFHSWCREIISANPQIFSNSNFSLLDDEDTANCFALLCGKNFKKDNYITADELQEVYSFMVNTRCSLSQAISDKLFDKSKSKEVQEKIRSRKPLFEEIIKKYIVYKREHSYIDYDDLLTSVAMAMRKSAEVCRFIATHYDHILVDEMQDTNPLQYMILEQFATYCKLFCVGDDAQSIYAFRGADFDSIHNFTTKFRDAETYKLTINYRSTQEILNLANWVLERSPLNYDKYLQASRGESSILPQLIHYEEEIEQAEDIINKIKLGRGEGSYSFSDHMVISRSLYGLRRIEACLIEAKIPYKIYGGIGLMQSAHVRDVVSALRITSNPLDELAWMRYLCLWPGVGERTAAKIIDSIHDQHTLGGILMKLEHKKLARPQQIDVLRNLAQHPDRPAWALQNSLKGMEEILATKYSEDWSRRREDFATLEEVARGSQNISSFIQEYVLDPKAETGLKSVADIEDCVTLTTIHQAKGLECANVYVVDVSWSKYPNARAITRGEAAIEEERRCLYVAITRAKDNLYLYRTSKAIRVDDPTSSNPDSYYFLNGLPSELTHQQFIQSKRHKWGQFKGNPINPDDLIGELDFS